MRTGDPVTAASARLVATNSNGGSPWTGKIRADRHKARTHMIRFTAISPRHDELCESMTS